MKPGGVYITIVISPQILTAKPIEHKEQKLLNCIILLKNGNFLIEFILCIIINYENSSLYLFV